MVADIPRRLVDHYQRYGFASLVREILITPPIKRIGDPSLKSWGALSGGGMFSLLSAQRWLGIRDHDIGEVSTVAVLGKGPSLTHADALEFIDTFIIVNSFEKELSQPILRELLSNKRIIHFTNNNERVLSRRNVIRFNIVHHQLSRFDPNKRENRPARDRFRPESRGLVPSFMPEKIAQYTDNDKNFPGSAGLNAVLFAAMALECQQVYTAGIDFFKTGKYFKRAYNKDPESQKTRKKIIDAENGIRQIADLCPDTEFHMITEFSFEHNRTNITFHNDDNLDNLPAIDSGITESF